MKTVENITAEMCNELSKNLTFEESNITNFFRQNYHYQDSKVEFECLRMLDLLEETGDIMYHVYDFRVEDFEKYPKVIVDPVFKVPLVLEIVENEETICYVGNVRESLPVEEVKEEKTTTLESNRMGYGTYIKLSEENDGYYKMTDYIYTDLKTNFELHRMEEVKSSRIISFRVKVEKIHIPKFSKIDPYYFPKFIIDPETQQILKLRVNGKVVDYVLDTEHVYDKEWNTIIEKEEQRIAA